MFSDQMFAKKGAYMWFSVMIFWLENKMQTEPIFNCDITVQLSLASGVQVRWSAWCTVPARFFWYFRFCHRPATSRTRVQSTLTRSTPVCAAPHHACNEVMGSWDGALHSFWEGGRRVRDTVQDGEVKDWWQGPSCGVLILPPGGRPLNGDSLKKMGFLTCTLELSAVYKSLGNELPDIIQVCIWTCI